MVIVAKENCLATGTVTKNGGEMLYFGEKKIPKYRFSLCVKEKKGETPAKYLNCDVFGYKANSTPKVSSGDMVLCAGELQTSKWTGKDGQERTNTVLQCDFVMVSKKAAHNAAQTQMNGFQPEEDFDMDGDVPF